MSLFLCVDCGGTKTSAVIVDASGSILGRALGGPSNITYLTTEGFLAAVQEAVGNALKTATTPPSETAVSLPPKGESPFKAAWFGISGADSPAAIAKVAEPLSQLLGIPYGDRLAIANDTHLLAAPMRMYDDVHYALAVIAGTGSIAVGFKEIEGKIVELGRAGGWGWILGDEGSGFDVGRETIRQILGENDRASVSRSAFSSTPFVKRVLEHFGVVEVMEIFGSVYAPDPREGDDVKLQILRRKREQRISTLPPVVFQAAFEEEDPLALKILRSCAAHLAQQIAVLLGDSGDVPDEWLIRAENAVISFGGSLVGVESYRRLILDQLESRGYFFKHVAFVDDAAATGALALAASFKK